MRSKGSRFTLGGEGVFARYVRNRPQPSATVRNRPQPSAWGPYGRAYGKFSRRGYFWRFQTWRCFVSRGRRGASWHSDVFCNASKVVLCGRGNTFASFSQDELQFSWQAQHFADLCRHFAWQAAALQTCRITCSTLHTLHSALHAPPFTLHTFHTLHSTLYTPDSTLYTLHFTLHTPHSTLYTLHSTLYTLHSTLYTLHCALHTPHFTLYTLHSTL